MLRLQSRRPGPAGRPAGRPGGLPAPIALGLHWAAIELFDMMSPAPLTNFLFMILVVLFSATLYKGLRRNRELNSSGIHSVHHPSPPRAAPFVCSPSLSRAQVSSMIIRESACPGHLWWPVFVSAAFTCRPVMIVNIGANKGYSLASFVDFFAPEVGVTPLSISPRVLAEVPNDWRDFPCGACNDCKVGHIPEKWSRECTIESGEVVPASHFPLELHGIDPILGNIAVCNKGVVAMVEEAGIPNVTVKMHHYAAVGNPNVNSVPFGNCPPGSETCGVEAKETVGNVKSDFPGRFFDIIEVPAVTVDTLKERSGIDTTKIDVLAIDTEGMDAEVLDGAMATFRKEAVKIIEFEYSGLRAWANRSLESVIEQLSEVGYDCFFAQQTSFIRLTGCWEAEYDHKIWSNVICVSRSNTELLAVANSFTFLGL